MTHSTNLPDSDIVTFCIYSDEYFFFAEDTLSVTQRYYTNIKLNYLSLHYFHNYKNGEHLFW